MYLFDTHADAEKAGMMLYALLKLDLNDDAEFDYLVEMHQIVKVRPSGHEEWITKKMKHTKPLGKMLGK